jgi:hypothetical protein
MDSLLASVRARCTTVIAFLGSANVSPPSYSRKERPNRSKGSERSAFSSSSSLGPTVKCREEESSKRTAFPHCVVSGPRRSTRS